jgi:hypothetical protein
MFLSKMPNKLKLEKFSQNLAKIAALRKISKFSKYFLTDRVPTVLERTSQVTSCADSWFFSGEKRTRRRCFVTESY